MTISKVNATKLLLKHGSNINHQNEHGKSALMLATNINAVKQLLKHGAQVDLQDKDGRSALIALARRHNVNSWYNDIKIADLLLKHGANINLQDNRGNSALINLDVLESNELVKILLQL